MLKASARLGSKRILVCLGPGLCWSEFRRMADETGHGSREVAVLGGGFAGTYCAHRLAKAGARVTLYDMGRSGFGIPQL